MGIFQPTTLWYEPRPMTGKFESILNCLRASHVTGKNSPTCNVNHRPPPQKAAPKLDPRRSSAKNPKNQTPAQISPQNFFKKIDPPQKNVKINAPKSPKITQNGCYWAFFKKKLLIFYTMMRVDFLRQILSLPKIVFLHLFFGPSREKAFSGRFFFQQKIKI